jgi:Flp pilus assembly CpaE family ATPase
MLYARAVLLTFTSLFVFHSAFAGSDGFSAIRCGADDVAKALIGKKMSNERVVDLEKRHEDLGLKDLGASEISEQLSCISWLICGSEFMLLQDKATVRDVLKIPAHSKKLPLFIGTCEMNGKETKTIVVAILDAETESGATTLPAKIAWKIDEKNGKFVNLSTEGLRCPRSGIITLDGGL